MAELENPEQNVKKNAVEEFKDFNKELEGRILEANNDETLVKWNRLLPELMGADVFMAGQYTDQVNANGDKILNILMMQKDNRVIVPFFTSPERMKLIMSQQSAKLDVLKINAVRFFQTVPDKMCILNPMSPYSRTFTPFEMRVLAAENEDKAPPLPAKPNRPVEE